MSERTLTLTWCSFTCYARRELPENVRLVELKPSFEYYKKDLFDERILNDDRIWCDFFETCLLKPIYRNIKNLAIVEDKSEPIRRFKNFGFFKNTVEITFKESENEISDFYDIMESLYEIIYEDILDIIRFFDIEFNYLISRLKVESDYKLIFNKCFVSYEEIFYNIFEPIRNYVETHFEGYIIAKEEFIYGYLNIFEDVSD